MWFSVTSPLWLKTKAWASAGLPSERAADPCLLRGDRVVVQIVSAAVRGLAVGGRKLIEQHEAGVVVVERVAQAGQVGAGAAEVAPHGERASRPSREWAGSPDRDS